LYYEGTCIRYRLLANSANFSSTDFRVSNEYVVWIRVPAKTFVGCDEKRTSVVVVDLGMGSMD